MKRSLTTCLILLCFAFTRCSEDELVSSAYLSADLHALSAANPKVPVLTHVAINGTTVTLSFTNHAAPEQPEGGYELMLDGRRTKLEVTDRIYSSSKNVTMRFSVEDPASKNYQIYARWNSGYKSSNALSGADASGAVRTQEAEEDIGDVEKPANINQPVIKDLIFDGKQVTIKFVNFAAPRQPEEGYELMLDGKRTYESITPRVNGPEKVLSMTFTVDDPKKHHYQVYALWKTGYIGARTFWPSQATMAGDDDEEEEEDDNNTPTPAALPNLKLVRAYEFEDNIGRNVDLKRDGLKVHHLGRKDGKVVSVDGVGAYHFRITPSGTKNSYRQELIPRNLPSPYFNGSNGFEPQWNKEYVYEFRMKLSSNHQMGSDWTSYFSAKNDYTVSRSGAFAMYVFGDHYWSRQYYARNHTTKRNGEASVFAHLDADGQLLEPNVDFKKTSGFGQGYNKYDSDINQWVQWTYHIKWSYTNSGFIRIYKNGKLFYDYNGPTGFKDDQAPYIKFGLYNSTWKQGEKEGAQLQEAFVDYLRVYVPENW